MSGCQSLGDAKASGKGRHRFRFRIESHLQEVAGKLSCDDASGAAHARCGIGAAIGAHAELVHDHRAHGRRGREDGAGRDHLPAAQVLTTRS